jgi:hypothetical protein
MSSLVVGGYVKIHLASIRFGTLIASGPVESLVKSRSGSSSCDSHLGLTC